MGTRKEEEQKMGTQTEKNTRKEKEKRIDIETEKS